MVFKNQTRTYVSVYIEDGKRKNNTVADFFSSSGVVEMDAAL